MYCILYLEIFEGNHSITITQSQYLVNKLYLYAILMGEDTKVHGEEKGDQIPQLGDQ